MYLRAFTLLLVSFYIHACTPIAKENDSATQLNAGKTQVVTSVATTTAEIKEVHELITGNGSIRTTFDETLTSQVAGLLITCVARNGLRVRAGDTLAVLDTTTIALRREKLNIQRSNTQTEYEGQLLGYEPLLKGKSTAEAALVREKLRAASGLTALTVELRALQNELDASLIKAPVDGILADVQVAAGMHVQPGQALFRIYRTRELFVDVPIMESECSKIRTGLSATIFPLAIPGKTYTATVDVLNPIVDQTGMTHVQLRVVNPEGLLLGMHAAVEIRIPSRRGVLVPKAALVLRRAKHVIFTLEDGRAKWNYVTPGIDNGKEVEIRAGIRAGALVILSNNLQLSHNAPVEAIN